MVRLSLFTVAVATVSAQNIAITGIPTTPAPNGAVPLRRELRDLQNNFPDQFNLLILGLQDFQAVDENDQKSYYQISGIHGLPYKPWNGVASTSDWQTTGGFGGYCTHSSILFAPWHRPYIALWEQSLYASVQKVAAKFPSGQLRDKYVTAAKDFRAPYWDWASVPPNNSPAFPTALSSPNITITATDGTSQSVDNPLHRFTFHPMNPSPGDFTPYWSQFPSTVRYPGQSDQDTITPIIANELSSLANNVGLLLLSYKNFDAFTYSRWDPNTSPAQYGSLEDVHNRIHDVTGGNGRGHMASLEASSYDPLFWMHHINVDRLWAIWQDLNPSAFMSPRPAPYSTFSTNSQTIEDRSSPLIPFWDSTSTKFWTSDEIKNSTTLFGYAYPETQPWLFPGNQSAYQSAIRSSVSKTYNMNIFSSASFSSQPKSKSKSRRLSRRAGSPIPPPLQYLAPNNTYTEYTVNIRASKLALGESFRVLAFLGPYDTTNSTLWDTEYNLIGRVSVLTRNMTTTALEDNDLVTSLIVSGTIPLTRALLQDILEDEGKLENLTPEKVVPYLREHLDWRVTLFSGEEKGVKEIPGLAISVASTTVRLGDDGVPVYEGSWRVEGEVTKGREGGLE